MTRFGERVREEGRAIRTADAVTAPSRDVLEQVRDFYGLALPEAEVIPNPTWPVPHDRAMAAGRLRPQTGRFSSDRFDRHKGGDLIIEAFGRVLHDVPDARLCFVGPDRGYTDGDGRCWDLEDFVRDRIPGALETGRIRWLGQQPFSALAEFRRRAMVSVVCSRYETFALTVIEAMASVVRRSRPMPGESPRSSRTASMGSCTEPVTRPTSPRRSLSLEKPGSGC